ncbi:MAG: hypothetical protein ACFB8W_22195 [Elainellaceae cyanobacterium]
MRGESGFGQVSVTQNLAPYLVYYETLIVMGDRCCACVLSDRR